MDDTGDFFNINEQISDNKCYVLIIYDIENDKRRAALAKYLQMYGIRVQKSAFEAMIKKNDYNSIIKGIKKYCKDNDSIRIYKLNALSEVTVYGNDIRMQDDDVIVI
ncbi:MAG: CRISPR-associated endonuclease Cas2 [Lachnospira eligens]|jgi:CRISPR-associated protein Cas2|uniref:CRISPR-associated endonuclease Cas2 n=1 Tax=Lachnospira eligens TaxID=39485 RepID=UPI003A22D6AE